MFAVLMYYVTRRNLDARIILYTRLNSVMGFKIEQKQNQILVKCEMLSQ